MTEFTEQFAAAGFPQLVEEFGASGAYTYTPAGGTAIAGLDGMWEPGQVLPGYYPAETQDIEYGVLNLSPDDVPAPSLHATVTFGGQTWGIRKIGDTKPLLQLQLERRTRTAVGRGHTEER